MAVAAVAVGNYELRLLAAVRIEMAEGNLLAVRGKSDRRHQVINDALRRATQAGDGVEDNLVLATWIVMLVVDVIAIGGKRWAAVSEPSCPRRNHLRLAAGCDLLYPQALLIAAFDVRGIAAIRRDRSRHRGSIFCQLGNLHVQRIDGRRSVKTL